MKAVTKTLSILFVFVALFLMVGVGTVSAQEEMTMDEYKAQLQQWVDREAAAKSEIAKCDAEIASLNSQISDVNGQIQSVWADIYNEIGTTEAEVADHRAQLRTLDSELSALANLSPEELFKKRDEVDAIEAKVNEHRSERIAALTEFQDKLAALEGKIASLRGRMPKALYDEYTVQRGDYLWRISRKPDVYGDPMQWVRIYSYNRDQIKDPDLIYPDQIFKIHKESGPDEYLVSPGDNLSKIAGSMDVLGDPTKWREIYEANKNVIGDEPGMIYPHQVLKIPR